MEDGKKNRYEGRGDGSDGGEDGGGDESEVQVRKGRGKQARGGWENNEFIAKNMSEALECTHIYSHTSMQ